MKKITKIFPILIAVFIGIFCSCTNKPPTCTLFSPSNGDEFNVGDKIEFVINANDEDGSVASIEIMAENELITTLYTIPFIYEWDTEEVEPGEYTITVTVIDDKGDETVSTVTVELISLFGEFTDSRDGKTYKTVKIGEQVWMAENLKTTKYNDGTEILNVTSDTQWSNLETGAYCNYDNLESNAEIYGRLYNWYAVNTGKLASEGWHVPSDDDWTILENYLIANGYNYDGTLDENRIAKSLCAKTNWELSSEAGTPGAAPENNNSTGFMALPGGERNGYNGIFTSSVGGYGGWWSSTEHGESWAIIRYLYCNFEFLGKDYPYKQGGYSVRLVRD